MAEAAPDAPVYETAPPVGASHFGDAERTPVAPPPWTLTGTGVIVVLRDTDRGPSKHGALGRFTLVMFVDYDSSPVGPYGELLFIPRVSRWSDVVGGTVEDIWVTSLASARNGNANWGLTKSVADIRREPGAGGVERWTASDDAGPLAEFAHRPRGLKFPVAKPRSVASLLQRRDGFSWVTPVSFVGWSRFSGVQDLWLDPDRIVDVERHRPIAAIQIVGGTLGFHEARVRPTT